MFILWLLIIDSYSHLALQTISFIGFFLNINFTAIHHFALYFTSYIAFDLAFHLPSILCLVVMDVGALCTIGQFSLRSIMLKQLFRKPKIKSIHRPRQHKYPIIFTPTTFPQYYYPYYNPSPPSLQMIQLLHLYLKAGIVYLTKSYILDSYINCRKFLIVALVEIAQFYPFFCCVRWYIHVLGFVLLLKFGVIEIVVDFQHYLHV